MKKASEPILSKQISQYTINQPSKLEKRQKELDDARELLLISEVATTKKKAEAEAARRVSEDARRKLDEAKQEEIVAAASKHLEKVPTPTAAPKKKVAKDVQATKAAESKAKAAKQLAEPKPLALLPPKQLV